MIRVARRLLLETVVLLAVGATAAFAGNALRSNHSIKWSHSYFNKSTGNGAYLPSPPPPTSNSPDGNPTPAAAPSIATLNGAAENGIRAAANPSASKRAKHDYQAIGLDAVKSAFDDPRHGQGLIVFVDARADEPFESGHIPGALQCDHYELDKYIDSVIGKTRVAEQVIVYCNGGECEDSIFMCTNLLERGLAYESVFLYEGGWKEWETAGMPIVKGRESE